jgi:hypothetical protein
MESSDEQEEEDNDEESSRGTDSATFDSTHKSFERFGLAGELPPSSDEEDEDSGFNEPLLDKFGNTIEEAKPGKVVENCP